MQEWQRVCLQACAHAERDHEVLKQCVMLGVTVLVTVKLRAEFQDALSPWSL